MGQEIWGVLAGHEGEWVAVNGDGKVVASAGTLDEVMRLTRGGAQRMTFVFAAAEDAAVRS